MYNMLLFLLATTQTAMCTTVREEAVKNILWERHRMCAANKYHINGQENVCGNEHIILKTILFFKTHTGFNTATAGQHFVKRG